MPKMQVLTKPKTEPMSLSKVPCNYEKHCTSLHALLHVCIGCLYLCPLLLIWIEHVVQDNCRRLTKYCGASVFVLKLVDNLNRRDVPKSLALHALVPTVSVQFCRCADGHGFVESLAELESLPGLELNIAHQEAIVSWDRRLEFEIELHSEVVAQRIGRVCIKYAESAPIGMLHGG